MYKTSDLRHHANHQVKEHERTIPKVPVNPDKVFTRRRIEEIQEQMAMNKADPLYG